MFRPGIGLWILDLDHVFDGCSVAENQKPEITGSDTRNRGNVLIKL